MTFVWLFAQQLGFWIADGWFRARSRATVAAIGAGAYLLLFGLVGVGYPGNMLDNLYPPTFAIVALAVGQTCLLVLAHPALERLMALRPVRVVVATVGSRLMTIYLWHLPVLALVIGLLLLTPAADPDGRFGRMVVDEAADLPRHGRRARGDLAAVRSVGAPDVHPRVSRVGLVDRARGRVHGHPAVRRDRLRTRLPCRGIERAHPHGGRSAAERSSCTTARARPRAP